MWLGLCGMTIPVPYPRSSGKQQCAKQRFTRYATSGLLVGLHAPSLLNEGPFICVQHLRDTCDIFSTQGVQPLHPEIWDPCRSLCVHHLG